jgi:hypothetical protein
MMKKDITKTMKNSKSLSRPTLLILLLLLLLLLHYALNKLASIISSTILYM